MRCEITASRGATAGPGQPPFVCWVPRAIASYIADAIVLPIAVSPRRKRSQTEMAADLQSSGQTAVSGPDERHYLLSLGDNQAVSDHMLNSARASTTEMRFLAAQRASRDVGTSLAGRAATRVSLGYASRGLPQYWSSHEWDQLVCGCRGTVMKSMKLGSER